MHQELQMTGPPPVAMSGLTTVCPQSGATTTVPFTASGTYLTLHVAPTRIVVNLRKP